MKQGLDWHHTTPLLFGYLLKGELKVDFNIQVLHHISTLSLLFCAGPHWDTLISIHKLPLTEMSTSLDQKAPMLLLLLLLLRKLAEARGTPVLEELWTRTQRWSWKLTHVVSLQERVQKRIRSLQKKIGNLVGFYSWASRTATHCWLPWLWKYLGCVLCDKVNTGNFREMLQPWLTCNYHNKSDQSWFGEMFISCFFFFKSTTGLRWVHLLIIEVLSVLQDAHILSHA